MKIKIENCPQCGSNEEVIHCASHTKGFENRIGSKMPAAIFFNADRDTSYYCQTCAHIFDVNKVKENSNEQAAVAK